MSFKKIIISFLLLQLTNLVYASNVKNLLSFKIEKVDSGSVVDFVWDLTSQTGAHLRIICPFPRNITMEKAHIKLFGSQDRYIMDLKIKDSFSCEKLNIFLRAFYYKIDYKNPIEIHILKDSATVESINLPPLDIYESLIKRELELF